MTVLTILQYPNPRLKEKITPVTTFDANLKKIIDDMYETLYASENCAALAANQLDIANPPHVTVIDFSEKKDQPLCLVNAKITKRSGETNTAEGCMSVAKARKSVRRSEKIYVESLDRYGKTQNFEADGFMAKCIQHELDHLDGMIFIDRLPRLMKNMAIQTILKHLNKHK
jgi:peptide deformylase